MLILSGFLRVTNSPYIVKDSADVVFEIKGDKKTAHCLVLCKAAPQLADLCVMEESPSFVGITIISPATFEQLWGEHCISQEDQ